MSGLSDEDYWSSSQTKAFNFDDEVINNQIASSKPGSESRSNNFKTKVPIITETPNSQFDCVLPVYHIITEKNFKKYVNDGKTKISDTKGQINVDATINNIILERPYDLSIYRSLGSKVKLLDKAIASADGKCILTVILLLVRTLKHNLVMDILKSHPVAFDHYIEYLTTRLNTTGITDLSTIKGHNSILGLRLFKILHKYYSSKESVESFKKKLQIIYNHWFENTTDENDDVVIKNYLNLLDWQMQILCSKDLNVEDFSVNHCLRYYCQNYWNSSGDNLKSPLVLAKQQLVSTRQLQWIQIDTKILSQSWDDIGKIFIKNNWFGNKKVINSLINAEDIVIRLGENNAPITLLEEFLGLMDDTNKSIALAIKYKCHRHVINVYIQEKNRVALQNYKAKLPQCEDYFYAENALRSTTTKWKN